MAAFLARRWFVIALGVSVGLALSFPRPVEAATFWMQPGITISVALLIMAWTMPTRSILGELKKPWASLLAILISYGALPAVGWLLGELSPRPDLRIGLLLSASVPCTLASCVLWTRLAGGNEATALLTVLGSTLISWLATTLWLFYLTGIDVEISHLMLELVMTLVLPVIVGQAMRFRPRWAEFADRHKTPLSMSAQIFILALVLKASANVGLKVRTGDADLDAGTLLLSAALSIGLHLMALAAGFWVSGWMGIDRPRCIAVAISCSQKTLPVSLFLFERYYQLNFPLAIVPLLFFHIGQLIFDTFIADHWKRRGARL